MHRGLRRFGATGGDSSRSRTLSPPSSRRSVTFQLDGYPVRKVDSVDSILNKIDTELSNIPTVQVCDQMMIS